MEVQQLIVGPMSVCCYIVSCDKTGEAVVIDPGDADTALAAIKAKNLKVKYIINTHCHPDHTCGDKALQAATGAQVVMHAADVAYIGNKENRDYFASIMGGSDLPPVDVQVNDGDVLEFGGEKLTVLHTPGHSPGGMCLYGGNNCFTGDTLFIEGTGRTDFPEGSEAQLMESIKTRICTLPDKETSIWPGHADSVMKPTNLKKVKRLNML